MNTNSWTLLIRINNLKEISRCEGGDVAEEIQMRVLIRVARICSAKGGLVGSFGRGVVGVQWDSTAQGAFIQREVVHRKTLTQEISADLQASIGSEPGGVVTPLISVEWELTSQLKESAPLLTHGWPAEAVESDVSTADMVYDALLHDRVELDFEPVCHQRDTSMVLYYESLVRIRNTVGNLIYPGEFIPALERLGLMRCLDRHVVRDVIARLKRDVNLKLGVNISAQSAVDDVWWSSTFAELLAMPDVTKRLTIEITETSQLPDGAGRNFCRYLQRLGCRIAIDDFGAGFGWDAIRKIVAPNLIKIDRDILRQSREIGACRCLEEIINMSREKGALVVVEGVESEEDLQFVRQAGGTWIQGHYLAKIGRPLTAE